MGSEKSYTGEVRVELRSLGSGPDELEALQRVLDAVPRYARAVAGAPFSSDEAGQVHAALPDGKSTADKFVFGIWRDEELVGCVDLIRGYPVVSTAMLGLLIIVERLQGRGIGSAAYHLVEQVIRSWDTCDRVRIGIVRTNEAAFPFWYAMGFAPAGESRPYECGSRRSEVVVFEKPLAQKRP